MELSLLTTNALQSAPLSLPPIIPPLLTTLCTDIPLYPFGPEGTISASWRDVTWKRPPLLNPRWTLVETPVCGRPAQSDFLAGYALIDPANKIISPKEIPLPRFLFRTGAWHPPRVKARWNDGAPRTKSSASFLISPWSYTQFFQLCQVNILFPFAWPAPSPSPKALSRRAILHHTISSKYLVSCHVRTTSFRTSPDADKLGTSSDRAITQSELAFHLSLEQWNGNHIGIIIFSLMIFQGFSFDTTNIMQFFWVVTSRGSAESS